MEIRLFQPEDLNAIKTLCRKHGINVPYKSEIHVAEGVDGEIKGFIGLRIVPFIEPLVSENAMASVKLFNRAEEIINANKFDVVRAITDEKYEALFNKVGFGKIFEKKIIMDKIYKRS